MPHYFNRDGPNPGASMVGRRPHGQPPPHQPRAAVVASGSVQLESIRRQEECYSYGGVAVDQGRRATAAPTETTDPTGDPGRELQRPSACCQHSQLSCHWATCKRAGAPRSRPVAPLLQVACASARSFERFE